MTDEQTDKELYKQSLQGNKEALEKFGLKRKQFKMLN